MRKFFSQVKQTSLEVGQAVRQAFRGKLTAIKSGEAIQKAQISGLSGEVLQEVEVIQQFGFTSVLPTGSQVVILPVGGRTTHSLVIASECENYRIQALKSGEVAVYNQSGASIILKEGKLIEVNCNEFILNASQKISLNTPLVEASKVLTAQGQINGNGGMAVQGGNGASFSGNVKQSSGSFTTTGDVQAGGISLKSHHHTEQGDGKPTSAAQA